MASTAPIVLHDRHTRHTLANAGPTTITIMIALNLTALCRMQNRASQARDKAPPSKQATRSQANESMCQSPCSTSETDSDSDAPAMLMW